MLNEFKNWLILNGASGNTAETYISRISEAEKHTPIDQWTKETIEAFLTKIKQEKKTSTFNSYLFAIRKFLAYQKKEIELPRATKVTNTLPKSFTEEYFEKEIIPTIEQLTSKDIYKIKAVLYFLFYTGIRVGEIDTLHRADIDLNTLTAKIKVSKTREERIVFFTKKTKQCLEDYFGSEPEETNAFNLASSALRCRFTLWKPYFKDINLHCHMFRHAYATNLLYRGIDLLSVSKLLGHKNISTTQRYLSMSIEQMQELYKAKIDCKRRK